MLRRLAVLAALALFVFPAPLRADELEAALRRRFAGEDEAWMLNAVLSDERQRQAFVKDGGAAAQGDESARRDFELRWRKKLVDFAEQYHRHLTTTDILPGAPSVEKMITEYEFNVTNYWLMAQSKDAQAAALKDIADGNAVLGLFRGTVEKRVRAKRKAAAETIGKYLASAPAQEALAYRPPPKPVQVAQPPVVAAKPPAAAPKPPPKPAAKPEVRSGARPEPPAADAAAIEELRRAEADARAAAAAREAELSARRAGEVFSGVVPAGGSVSAPTDASMGLARPLPNAGLVAASPDASQGGGFVVNAPPSPLASREGVVKSSPGKVILERIVPTAVGAVLGGLAGFFLGGPAGLLAGLLVGAAAGYFLTKK